MTIELEHLEALALSDDRERALAQLLPGTEAHDYWRGIHLQHGGRLDEVDEILGGWVKRHTHKGEAYTRLERRQRLLRAGEKPSRHADKIRFECGIALDDQAEAEAAAQRYPTALDPSTIARHALLDDAIQRTSDLSYVTDWALPDLVLDGAKLQPNQRRHILQRLHRANLDGLLELIAADLADRNAPRFGQLAVHGALTLDQLDALAALRTELPRERAWVDAVLTRMRPPPHVDLELDLGARAAHLDALLAFAAALPPSFNGLRSDLLHHRLDVDRRTGALDGTARARLVAYLALPRHASYVDAQWARKFDRDQLVSAGAGAATAGGLGAVDDGTALVRELLEHYLATDDGADLAQHLDDAWFEELRATARLLSGAPDSDRWASVLGPTKLAALRDRVDIELTARNPARWGADDAVALEVDVKHVAALTVKVYRIDAVAYFLARGAEVDTALDLDGMVAGDERTLRYDEPALRRVRRRIELPACARPGTYVVELIGNGRSSRALIRKGGLRHTVRVGAAGSVVRVCDDAGRPVTDARLWLGGRELTPRDDGAIAIPFSTHPGAVPVLLVHGDVTSRELLQHPAESYQFSAGVHVEREALVPGRTAQVALRPILSVAGWPAPIALVTDARVELTVTDLSGTASTKTQAVALRDDAEAVVELRVPEDAARLAITVRGRIRVASTQQDLDVSDHVEASVADIHRTAHTEAMHVAHTAGGHVLTLLGKTGEPRGARAVSFTLHHRATTFDVATTLETDARGRIELGALDGIERVTATLPSGVQQTWWPLPATEAPRVIHTIAGQPITLPAPAGVEDASARWLALVELRGDAPARDLSAHVTLEARALVIRDLPAGQHALLCRGLHPVTIVVAPADAVVTDGWAAAGTRTIELTPPAPLVRELAVEGDHVVVRISDAGANTRVHVVGTRYLSDAALPRSLHRAPRPRGAPAWHPVRSHYVSGRDLGEEYRYVLERRTAPRRPGTLLERPGLLLNPWALRTTSSSVHEAAAGGAYHASPPRPASAPAPARPQGPGPHGATSAFPSLDFLAAAATLHANCKPYARGEVRVALAELGAAQHVRVIVVDAALTSTADLPLAERDVAPRDRRLRAGLDPARHLAEDRRVEGLPSGTVVVVEDTSSGKLELVDTVARAHQLLLTLGADAGLRELGFVATWHALTDADKRSKYSKHACHELHLFLRFKDPEFFARVVQPYLAHRRDKTFVDRWLLDEDVSPWLEPWAFGRLNTLERILLARRVPAARAAITRLLGDAVDLIPPAPERDAHLVDTLLGASALEGGGVMAEAAAAPEELLSMDEEAEKRPADAKMKKMRSRRADTGAGEGFGGPGGGAPPPPAPRMVTLAIGGAAPAAAAGDFDDVTLKADLAQRERQESFYRGADKTQEWAESSWRHVRVEHAGPDLIPPNRFWRDLARHSDGDGPFLSPHLGECTTSFAAAMCALAVLDLPFVAGVHAIVVDDRKLTLTAASHALVARTRIAEVTSGDASPILVGQSYFRADDRWEWDGAEQREKYVTGELLTGVVYQCQVVVTNPTSAQQRLAVLLQLPRGAIAVSTGFTTRTFHLHLSPYGTQSLEYAFYFPFDGQWSHYPAHVTRGGVLLAAAAPTTLTVVREPSTTDTGSWAHVSQHGSLDDVLACLDGANLGRIDLGRIAWRMRDKAAFERVTARLAERHVYDDRLWSYALRHADRARLAEWLRHQEHYVRPAGPVLDGAIVDLDPVDRHWYQHLEYAPLVNARAHQLGARRRILNDALATQYRAFLDVVAHRARPGDADLLAAAHYLLTLDRVDDALAALARVRPDHVTTRLQHAYLAAYAACTRGDLAEARALAAPHADHPVDRWRHRFAALLAMLDEATGGTAATAVDTDSRDQRMAESAARQPSLELTIDKNEAVLQHHAITAAQLRCYRMDIELLFSRQPFVQGDVDRFSWIEPNVVVDVSLSPSGRTVVPLPASVRGANLVIEAVAPGLRRAVAHYAHDLAVQLAHQFGQVKVLRASSQTALPATYVKVYGRRRGGAVSFFKDGYTDVRGRFDYATLSTDDLDHVERFAILVVSDDAGATVVETAPPPR